MKKIFLRFVILFFLFYTIFWFRNTIFYDPESFDFSVFINTYGLLALFGGIFGLISARKWGGYKSLFGKSILMLSFGLLFQELGQIIYSYYFYVAQIDIPYPSWGDVGFFGSVIFYIIAAFYIYKISGADFALETKNSAKFEFLMIPLVIFAVSYWFLLRGREFEPGNFVQTFLDLGYPLFQSVYVSVALVTYRLATSNLGGHMRKYILFLIGALVMQYASDFTFLYTTQNGTWIPGGINDYMYFVSYFLMTLAIVKLDLFFDSLTNQTNV